MKITDVEISSERMSCVRLVNKDTGEIFPVVVYMADETIVIDVTNKTLDTISELRIPRKLFNGRYQGNP